MKENALQFSCGMSAWCCEVFVNEEVVGYVARSMKFKVLVSWRKSLVGELLKAPTMKRFPKFCKVLNKYSTFFLFLVVSQAMLPQRILGFRTAVISIRVSFGLSPQKHFDSLWIFATVALPCFCILLMWVAEVSLGPSHSPNHRSSLVAVMTWSPRRALGLFWRLWVKCITWAFFLSQIPPCFLPQLRDLCVFILCSFFSLLGCFF